MILAITFWEKQFQTNLNQQSGSDNAAYTQYARKLSIWFGCQTSPRPPAFDRIPGSAREQSNKE